MHRSIANPRSVGTMARMKRHRRTRRPLPPLSPAPTDEMTGERELDLADRRDAPPEGHVNVGPDDRSPPHVDEVEGAERVPDVDSWVIERVASHTDTP